MRHTAPGNARSIDPRAVDISVELATTRLKSPFVLLSGTVSRLLLSMVEPSNVGAVVLKTVTLAARDPNPEPRMWDLGYAALNSIGLFNPGADAFFGDELPRFLEWDFDYIVSLGEFSTKGFVELIDIASDVVRVHERVRGIELNVSCPNVKEGGITFSRDVQALARIIEEASERIAGEIWVKVSPAGDVSEQVRIARDHGATAVVVANTHPAAFIDPDTGAAYPGAGSGGLSGPGLLPLNVHGVRSARDVARDSDIWLGITHEVDAAGARRALSAAQGGSAAPAAPNVPTIPIIASGGVATLEDALTYFQAGASLIGVGTAFMVYPDTPKVLANALREWVASRGIGSLAEMLERIRQAGQGEEDARV